MILKINPRAGGRGRPDPGRAGGIRRVPGRLALYGPCRPGLATRIIGRTSGVSTGDNHVADHGTGRTG